MIVKDLTGFMFHIRREDLNADRYWLLRETQLVKLIMKLGKPRI